MLVSFTEAGTALVTTFGLTAAAEIITYMWQTLRTPLEHPAAEQLAGAAGPVPGAAENGSENGSGSGEISEAEDARSGGGSGSGSDGEEGPVEGVRRHSLPQNRHVSFDERAHSDEEQ